MDTFDSSTMELGSNGSFLLSVSIVKESLESKYFVDWENALGRGRKSIVFYAYEKENNGEEKKEQKEVAIKILERLVYDEIQLFENEVKVLKALEKYEFVVKLIDHLEINYINCLIFEYCETNLREYLNNE